MIPVEQQKDPRNDIGPFYKSLGFVALGLALLVTIIQGLKGGHVGLYDAILVGICSLLCLALWRPDSFDNAIKALADHLPSFSFTKREVTQKESTQEFPIGKTTGEYPVSGE